MSNELVVTETGEVVDNFVHPYEHKRYTSLTASDSETRKRVFSAVQNAKSLKDDAKGKTILVEHIIRIPATRVDPVMQEDVHFLRTIFVGPVGSPSYAAGSGGIDLAVDNILSILGDPADWDEPYAFTVLSGKTAKGEYLSLGIAE